MKIYKYLLDPIRGTQTIKIPERSTFLSLQMQGSHIAIWALVSPDKEEIPHEFIIKDTGEDCSEINGLFSFRYLYLGTIQDKGYIRHVFLSYKNEMTMRIWNNHNLGNEQ